MSSGQLNWVCPHCGHAQTVTEKKHAESWHHIGIDGLAEGSLSLVSFAVGCANPDCEKLTLSVTLQPDEWNAKSFGYDVDFKADPPLSLRLLPESAAKPQPDYIPAQLRQDYAEACRIQELSPKASATLARRCLQGMIRNFSGITKSRLIEEIRALRESVDTGKAPAGVTPESVDAIDQVREVGNIGAHMEADVDQVIDVDPGEAGVLIELIEMLFDEWYVARHVRQQRLAKVAAVAAEKRQQVADARSAIRNSDETTEPSGTEAAR
jgi:hypothetical protein